jgi:hypothetical protein
LLKVWIPSQPDRDALEQLMIEVGWDTRQFLRVVQEFGEDVLDDARVAASRLSDIE